MQDALEKQYIVFIEMGKFKTRARALDLLGRQQIAGIPSAINELIKNAYDAYADHFDAALIRASNALVLRDDGVGMTKEEFENRWLVLATESKFRSSSLPPKDPDKPERPVSGEKGIGRLAIASIGKHVLILTKSKIHPEAKIVASLVCWDLFEIPGINIEDIDIPVKEYDALPDREQIMELKNEALDSLVNLYREGKIARAYYDSIRASISTFNIVPKELQQLITGPFDLEGKDFGTHFYVSPVEDTLYADLQKEPGQSESTKIETMLLGFHNTMTPNHVAPSVDISFRDFRENDGSFVSLIDKESFFTPDEFSLADHHIQGEFDKYGQFKGTVTIYNDKEYQHSVEWRDNHYREVSCGPFKIDLAYIQGEEKSSRMSNTDYIRIKEKTDRLGGLYIYRNNIRVLPYGNSDYDFIDIEKNRSKRASTYYFSYRRMFGAIEISGLDKSQLQEKAGREGFIENTAYKQFRSILKNFFVQLSLDFFSDQSDTPQAEFFKQKKEEFSLYHKALERRDKLSKTKKERFSKQLMAFFDKFDRNGYEQDVNNIIKKLSDDLSTLPYLNDSEEASKQIINFECEARRSLSDYKKSIIIPSPKGFSVSRAQRIDYTSYCEKIKDIESAVFIPAGDQIDRLIEDCTSRLQIEISKRKRLEQSVDLISQEAMSANKKKKAETLDVVNSVSKRVKDLTNELLLDLDGQIKDVKEQFSTLAIQQSEDFDLVSERRRMEDAIAVISDRNAAVMDRLIRQLESFYWEKDESGEIVTNDQIADAMSEELEEAKDRLQSDLELSQLGLAVGIIHHEFNGTINSIRHSLKDLKAWSDVDDNLEGVYKNIKINFEHLDGYLSLFTPLNRRLSRNRENIPLLDINAFLIDLFKSRLERHNIALKHTKGFSKGALYGYRSTFYPVFVNIVDNAIYWLTQSENPERVVRLHADDEGNVYISNNGPFIKQINSNRIFELRYSTKPNGRGLGLSISREVLNDENYNLTLDQPREGATVTFKISPKNQ